MTPAQVTASLDAWETTLELSTDPWADAHNPTPPRPVHQATAGIASSAADTDPRQKAAPAVCKTPGRGPSDASGGHHED